MNKVWIIILFSTFLCAQSQYASLTIYKDGTALVKQPVNWSIKSGYNYKTWDKLPNGIDRDTPFLNVSGVDIISQRFNDDLFSGSDLSSIIFFCIRFDYIYIYIDLSTVGGLITRGLIGTPISNQTD